MSQCIGCLQCSHSTTEDIFWKFAWPLHAFKGELTLFSIRNRVWLLQERSQLGTLAMSVSTEGDFNVSGPGGVGSHLCALLFWCWRTDGCGIAVEFILPHPREEEGRTHTLPSHVPHTQNHNKQHSPLIYSCLSDKASLYVLSFRQDKVHVSGYACIHGER